MSEHEWRTYLMAKVDEMDGKLDQVITDVAVLIATSSANAQAKSNDRVARYGLLGVIITTIGLIIAQVV